ncbi:MAG: inner membrane-spanning protein YciB [Pseudohongiellaceae bacterium]|jgi:intracellular septation protein
MKQFLEYIPLFFFLIVYKLDERLITIGTMEFTFGGIFSATAFLMLSTVLAYGIVLKMNGSLTRMQWIVVAAVLLFGSSTLILRSEEILKWKAPVVNWIMAAIFLGSQFIGKENMAKSMFGQIVSMPDTRWIRLNLAWVLVFFVVGCTNLLVAFTYHEYWVDFKVFGSMGMLILASIGQMFYIYPYLQTETEAAENQPKKP